MKHPVTIRDYEGSLGELGEELGRLRYDALLCVLSSLCHELSEQMESDATRGRVKLAQALAKVCMSLASAGLELDEALVHCNPYLREDFAVTPKISLTDEDRM